MLRLSQPITAINGFRIGDTVRLKDGDGRPHIIKSFAVDGLKEFFFVVQFEDGTETMLSNISFLRLKESEDEKIREELVYFIQKEKEYMESKVKPENSPKLMFLMDALAYLERQKEQKPAELPKSEDYGIDGLYAAIDILQTTLGKVKGYQTDDGILEHKCAISAVKELYEQKPAEWSEEGKKRVVELKTFIAQCNGFNKANRQKAFELIDALRPNWKPSEDQMEWLESAVRLSTDKPRIHGIVVSLYEQLKKL